MALLHEGRLLALDTPTACARPTGHRHRMIAPIKIAPDVLERAGIADVQVFGERAHVRLDAGAG